ncbi:MAG: NADP-dependent oxidoreductase [Coxiellaceae bacterium]|nr:NADP-dependent oxidoreductase [Coxiellaceae bacterium]
MKAMAIETFGDVDIVKSMDLPKPVAGDDEVLIKITHAGINPVDWKICQGAFKDFYPYQFPIILGWDAAGVVEQVGSAVSDYQLGDKVYAYCRKEEIQHGTFAEYVVVDQNALAVIPNNISLSQAAGIPLVALTAWQSLFDFAELQSGQRVLIHAGAGGVGSLAIQFAKHAGAKVYTTASEKNHDYLKQLGADVVIDYNQQDFVATMKQLEPEGVDVVYDTVGAETQQRSFDLVKKGGVLVSIVEPPNEERSAELGLKTGFVFVAPNSEQLKKITHLIEQGTVIPAVTTELPFDQAVDALQQNLSRHVCGKLVLSVA